MDTTQILEIFQNKVNEIFQEQENMLNKLNKEAENKHFYNTNNPRGKNDVNISYYQNIAVYAWAARAKKDVLGDIQGLINKIKKDIEHIH